MITPLRTPSHADQPLVRTSERRWFLRAICEGCHIGFKPDLPTGVDFGELSSTAADFEKPDIQ